MSKLKSVMLGVVVLGASLSAACGGGGGGGSQPQSGFKVQGEKYVAVFGGGFHFISRVNVQGSWQFDNGSAVGTVTSFGPFLCLGDDPCPVTGGRVPARWTIFAGAPGDCFRQITDPNMNVTAGETKVAQCETLGLVFAFSSSPATVNLLSPPANFELTGSGLSTAYGMPYVEYVDEYTGDLIGGTTASAVSADGTWLQAPMPDLSSVYNGTYNILISNRRPDGSLEYVGTSTMNAFGRLGQYVPPDEPCPETFNYTGGGWMEQPIDECDSVRY